MRSCNSYQDIKTPEDEEEEREIEAEFENLCDFYADEIAEQGMNSYQRARLRQMARRNIQKRHTLSDE